MRGAVHLSVVSVAVVLLAGLALACTTAVTVAVDHAEDFSDYTTWDWLPESVPPAGAGPPLPPSLHALVVRNVERTLRERGYARSRDRADFFVSYELAIRRRAERVQEPFAPYLVDSYNSSASYWVEGTNNVERQWNDLTIAIRISEPHGRTTWAGAVEDSVEAWRSLPVGEAVEALIARFAEQQADPSAVDASPFRGAAAGR